MFRQSEKWRFPKVLLAGGTGRCFPNKSVGFFLFWALIISMMSCPSIAFGQAKPTRNTSKDVVRFSVSSRQLSFSSDEGSELIRVIADDSWSIIEKPQVWWATATKTNNTLSIVVQQNTSKNGRSTVVKIKCANKTISIPIEQQGCLFSVSKSLLSFPAGGGSETIFVESDGDWDVSVYPNNWGHLSKNGKMLTLKVAPNQTQCSRSDWFCLKSGDKTVKVNISQEGKKETEFSVSKTSLTFSAGGGSETIVVESSSDWEVYLYPNSWGHLSRNGNTLALKVEPNWSQYNRIDYFCLKSGDKTIKVNISQEGKKETEFSVSKTSLTFSAGGGSETIFVEGGSDWWVFVYPNSWVHLSRDGNTLALKVDPNYSRYGRSDYFSLKSGNTIIRVDISQEGKGQSQGTIVTGNVTKVWVEHNVIDSYGNKGMIIHVKFDINGMLNKTGQCAAYFYSSNGNPLKDSNQKYRTSNGNVATHVDFTPDYQNSTFNDLAIFMPYSEFHLSQNTSCYFTISLWNGNNEVARSSKYYFDITF